MSRAVLFAFAIVTIVCACAGGIRTALPNVPYSMPNRATTLAPMTAFTPVAERVVAGKNGIVRLPMPAGYSAQVKLGAASSGTVVYAVTAATRPRALPAGLQGALLFTQFTASRSLLFAAKTRFSYTLPAGQLDPKASYAVVLYDPSNPSAGWQTGYTAKAPVAASTTVTVTVTAPSFVGAGLTYVFALAKSDGSPPAAAAARYELRGTLRQVSTYAYPSPSQPPQTLAASVVQYYTVGDTPVRPPSPIPAGKRVVLTHVTEVDTQPLQTTQQASDEYFRKDVPFAWLVGSVGYSFPPRAAAADTTTTAYATPLQLQPKNPSQTSWSNSPQSSVDQDFADGSTYQRTIAADGSYTETGTIPNPANTPASPTIVESPSGAGSYTGPFFADDQRTQGIAACSYAFGSPSGSSSSATISIQEAVRPTPTATCAPAVTLATIPAWFGASPAFYDENDTAAKNPVLPASCGPLAGTTQALLVTRTVRQLDTIVGFTDTTVSRTYYGSNGVACVVLHDLIREYYDWKGDATMTIGSHRGEPYLSLDGRPISTVDTHESLWLANGASGTAPPAVAAAAQAHFLARVAAMRADLRRTAARASSASLPQNAAFEWGSLARDGMTYAGPADEGERLHAFVEVKMRDSQGLLRAAQERSLPGSPEYRQFLTPEQIADRYLATPSDYERVAGYFSALGLQVTRYPQRHAVQVAGTLAQMRRAFNTPFGRFHYHGRPAIAPVGTPHFSTDLPVTSVVGLLEYAPFTLMRPIRANPADFYGYSPQQIAHGLDFSSAYAVGYDGSGVTAGVVQLGPIYSGDVHKYAATYHWKTGKIVTVHPVPVQPRQTPSGGDPTEAALDTQTVAALAPGAKEEFLEDLDGWYDAIELAIARNVDDTISASTSTAEPVLAENGYINDAGTGPFQIALAVLATEGIAFFASSGDYGSSDQGDCYSTNPKTHRTEQLPACVGYPAEDPNVVGVGAADVPLDAAGNLIGEITAWSVETTHGGPLNAGCVCVGSGGGYSRVIAAPVYQAYALKREKSFDGKREVPDVAFDGAPNTGVGTVTNGQPSLGFGTSEAAPMANAAWAVVLSACAQNPGCATAKGAKPYRLGNPNPLLYGIYRGRDAGGLTYRQAIYDVLYGDNTPVNPSPSPSAPPPPKLIGYSAGKNYDLVTGIGVPFVGHLINALIPGAGVP